MTLSPSHHSHTTTQPAARRLLIILLSLLAIVPVLALNPGVAEATTFSPYVNVWERPLPSPAGDCKVKAGAMYRNDGRAQGAADVVCSYRHAQIVLDVQLYRWNGSGYVAQGSTWYTYNNSWTTPQNQVTLPVGTCGRSAWYTVATAYVLTGSKWSSTTVSNQPQWYDPCTKM